MIISYKFIKYIFSEVESDTDRSSLPESETLVKSKPNSDNYDYQISEPTLEIRDQGNFKFFD